MALAASPERVTTVTFDLGGSFFTMQAMVSMKKATPNDPPTNGHRLPTDLTRKA